MGLEQCISNYPCQSSSFQFVQLESLPILVEMRVRNVPRPRTSLIQVMGFVRLVHRVASRRKRDPRARRIVVSFVQ